MNVVDPGQKRLILIYDLPLFSSSRYSIEVEAFLPSSSLATLDLESSNGESTWTEIRGDALGATTSNGPLLFDMFMQSLWRVEPERTA